jgi:hypothetical protein
MRSRDHTLKVYEDLAQWYERQGQAKLRDWFLVLAADAALAAGRADEAERLRGRLLHVNPHHLLRPFDSFADALKSPDVQGYVVDLRRTYPPQAAEQLLQEQRQQSGETVADDKAGRPLGVAADREETEVQVFRLEAGLEEPRSAPPPRPTAAPRPALKPSPASLPASVERPPPRPVPPPPSARPRLPTSVPAPWTLPPAPAPEPQSPAPGEGTDPTSTWVSGVLFCLVLMGGLALVAYVLLRPLLAMDLF